MGYDDLDKDPGDEVLDDLGDALSGKSESESESDEQNDDEPDYDPLSEPAFMTDKKRTQHTMYCLPDVWDEIDGSAGLLFEAEAELRRDGVDAIQKRELYNALFAAAVKQLDSADIAEELLTTRRERGPKDEF